MSGGVKIAGEAGANMITGLVKQNIVEGLIPAGWSFSTIIKYWKGKEGALGRGNCRELKLAE